MSASQSENLQYRKKEFKRGIDTDSSRRKRDEDLFSIRKQKREGKLSVKRGTCLQEETLFVNLDATNTFGTEKTGNMGNIGNTGNMTEKLLHYISEQDLAKVYSDNPDFVLLGLTKLRKVLSTGNSNLANQLSAELIQRKVHLKIVEYFSYVNYPKHQKEAAWIITNMVSGKSETSQAVIHSTPLVEYCFAVLDHTTDIELADQIFWCLGNIGGEGITYRDKLLEYNIISRLTQSISREFAANRIKTMKNQIWSLQNLARFKINSDEILSPLNILKSILTQTDDDVIISDIIYYLVFITKNMSIESMNKCIYFFDRSVLSLLNFSKGENLLRVCGNLATGPDHIVQVLLDNGLLEYIPKMFSKKSTTVKEVCWMLSNITAGSKTQISQVLDSNIISNVLILLATGNFQIKKECIYVIGNLVSGASGRHIQEIVDLGVISILCDVLDSDNVEMIQLCLSSLKKILESTQGISELEKRKNLLEDAGGLDKLELLQNHKNDKIYKKCHYILEKHFT